MHESESVSSTRLKAIVRGRVQGVGFRYATQNRARELGLVGYVRNRWNLTVEVVAEGPEKAVRQLLSWLHVGPSMARVARVEEEWQQPLGTLSTFEVRF